MTVSDRSSVAVTGASGLLGAEFSRRLQASGRFAVTEVLRGPQPAEAGSSRAGVQQIRTARLFEGDWIAGLPSRTTVIHCAGLSNPRHPFGGFAEVLRDHVLPHLGMVEAMLARGWRGRMIYLSSGGAIYGEPQCLPISETHPLDPISFYGLQKLCIERGLDDLSRRHGFGLVVLRVSNPYGAARVKLGQGVIPLLIGALRRDQLFRIIGNGSALRDYIHIDDLWHALERVIDDPLPESRLTLNIGSGQGVSLNALIARLENLTGHRLRCAYEPARHDVASNVLDCSRARFRLGWSPRIPLWEGLQSTLEILHDDPSA